MPHVRHSAAAVLTLMTTVFVSGLPAQIPTTITEDVTFGNGPVTLAASVITPRTSGPHPAVVFLHGSGPTTREGARAYAERFAELGLASFIFDKRGTGSSTGSWLTSSLDDLAGDAVAAVAYMRTRRDIDEKRIGLWGVSQAAWVATLAASRYGHIAFMILISGGGVPPRESELFAYTTAFRRAGLSPADTAQAMRVLDSYFEYLAEGTGRTQLVATIDSARESAWYPHARLDRILPDEEHRRAWRWVAAWDPTPHMARIRSPVLLMFGAQDQVFPTDRAVHGWREAFQRGGNRDVTIRVFPEAGHGIRLANYAGEGRAPFAEGYWETMIDWLQSNVTQKDR